MSWSDDPRVLNQWGTYSDAGGSIAGALSHLDYARDAARALHFQAEQMRQNAGQAQAAAQREAYSVEREAEYTASRALAVAAASGGGASDPTVVGLMARNAAEMAYRKQIALYEGDEQARMQKMGAEAKDYEAASARRAGNVAAMGKVYGAGTSLLRGYARDSSLMQRFGGDGPNTDGGVD